MRYSNSIHWISGEPGPGGLGLQIDWDGREAVVHLDVPSSSQAAPGIAHGGFLAALADHLMGFVAAQQGGRAAVTRQMTVDYLAPTHTSQVITIRARAESVTERTVVVSLEGAADDSGLDTFKARVTTPRVSPGRRHPGSAEVDYDTLEERFDPSQIFGWLAWSPQGRLPTRHRQLAAGGRGGCLGRHPAAVDVHRNRPLARHRGG